LNYSKNSYILLINKERSISSQRTIGQIKRELGTKKIGFAGTLDPEAQGLLVVGVNRGTKYLNTFENSDKEYMVELKFGYETATLDVEGEVVEKSDIIPSIEQIIPVVESFLGVQEQIPPIYSAIKQNGVRSYQRARSGEEFTLPKRSVEIKELRDIKFENKILSFTVLVSKGTYIRSLVRDIAYKLGTFATMTKLTRTKVGPFELRNAATVSDIYDAKAVIPVTNFYPNNHLVDYITLSENMQKAVKNGNSFKMNTENDKEFIFVTVNAEVKVIYKRDGESNNWNCEANLW
jgi:tRNA pseudouridine55 synthase